MPPAGHIRFDIAVTYQGNLHVQLGQSIWSATAFRVGIFKNGVLLAQSGTPTDSTGNGGSQFVAAVSGPTIVDTCTGADVYDVRVITRATDATTQPVLIAPTIVSGFYW